MDAVLALLPRLDPDMVAGLVGKDGVLTRDVLECVLALHGDLFGTPSAAGFDDSVVDLATAVPAPADPRRAQRPRWVVVDALSRDLPVHTEVWVGQIVCVLPSRPVQAVSTRHGRVACPSGVFVASAFGLTTLEWVPAHDSDAAVGDHAAPARPSVSLDLLCVSPVFVCARAQDFLFDTLFWGWTGTWTEQLEFALADLVVGVNETVRPILMQMSASMPSESAEFGTMLELLDDKLEEALSGHDHSALGQVHSTCYQLMEMNNNLPIRFFPPALIESIAHFERIKLSLSHLAPMRARLETLLGALAWYVRSLDPHAFASQVAHAQQAQRVLTTLLAQWDVRVAAGQDLSAQVHFSTLTSIKGNMTDLLMNMMSSGPPDPRLMCTMPAVPMEQVGDPNPAVLDRWTDVLVENCAGGAVMLGSMMGFKLTLDMPPAHGHILLHNVLRSGMAFVGSGARVLGLLGFRRAVLPLTPGELPAADAVRFKDRIKDLARRVKNGLKGCQLSLRFNTDFARTMRGVHAHHKPSWLTPELERVWAFMWSIGAMVTCELWLRTPRPAAATMCATASVDAAPPFSSSSGSLSGSSSSSVAVSATAVASDAGFDEEMIAADVGFPSGRAFYVATRFSLKQHRALAPGFILSFTVTRVLQEAGYVLWDLGDTDSSAPMAYKQEIALQLERPQALARWRAVRALPGQPNMLPLGQNHIPVILPTSFLVVDASVPALVEQPAVGKKPKPPKVRLGLAARIAGTVGTSAHLPAAASLANAAGAADAVMAIPNPELLPVAAMSEPSVFDGAAPVAPQPPHTHPTD